MALDGYSVLGGKFLERCSFLVKGNRFISWPQAARQAVSLFASDGEPPIQKDFPNSAPRNAKASSYLSKSKSFIPQGDGFIQGPFEGTGMQSSVFGLGHQLKIGGMVVKSVPVAVMDNFPGAELATKSLLHHDAMLKSLTAVHVDKPILCVPTEIADMAFSFSHEREHNLSIIKSPCRILTIPVSYQELRKAAEREAGVAHVLIKANDLMKAAPFIGPRGGRWADAAHKIPWKEEKRKYKVPTIKQLIAQGYKPKLAELVHRNISEKADTDSWTEKRVTAEKHKYPKLSDKVGDKTIEVFRVVPKGVQSFNSGDYAFANRSEAEEFRGEYGYVRGQPEIISMKAKSSDFILPHDDDDELIFTGHSKLKKATGPREFRTISGNIPAFIAAAASPAGNRNPGQGTVINQLVGARKTPVPMMEDLVPSAREWVESQLDPCPCRRQ